MKRTFLFSVAKWLKTFPVACLNERDHGVGVTLVNSLHSIVVQRGVEVIQTLHPFHGVQVVRKHVLGKDTLHQQPVAQTQQQTMLSQCCSFARNTLHFVILRTHFLFFFFFFYNRQITGNVEKVRHNRGLNPCRWGEYLVWSRQTLAQPLSCPHLLQPGWGQFHLSIQEIHGNYNYNSRQ